MCVTLCVDWLLTTSYSSPTKWEECLVYQKLMSRWFHKQRVISFANLFTLFPQVDVGYPTLIGRLRIQKLSAYEETDRHYVSQFYLSHSLNGWEWNTKLHEGVTKVKFNVNTWSVLLLSKLSTFQFVLIVIMKCLYMCMGKFSHCSITQQAYHQKRQMITSD